MRGARQANFTLPEELLEDLKRTVPRGEQSRVVSAALCSELKRIKFRQTLDESFGAWRRQPHPELAQGARRLVRKLRRSTRFKPRVGDR